MTGGIIWRKVISSNDPENLHLVWPFAVLISDELDVLLDQYLDVMMNFFETRTFDLIGKIACRNLVYGIGFGAAVIVTMLFTRAVKEY